MRLKSFDNYLITAMSALALMSLYMLYGAKLVNFNSASEIKVASIVEQLKTVKRKRDFYQGWMDVRPGDGLSQNDEIYTHGQSSAKIRFTNGPEISLFENSLLRIKTAGLGSTFSLDKGNLIAKLDKNSPVLDIELNGKKYTFNSDNANIQIEQGKEENKFLILDGKARLADQEILPNQVVIQNIKTGNLKIKEIPFISKLPSHNFIQYYFKEASVNFSWTYTSQSSPAKLSIARDSNFTDIIFEELIETNSHQFVLNQKGTYYWKLTSQDLVDGPIKSFSLVEETSPIINVDQDLLYRGPKSTDKAFLSWSKNNGKNFSLKIEGPDGKSEEILTNKNNYDFSPEASGEYRLSVKVSENSRPHALWSEPVLIKVSEAKAITISALTPDFLEKVNYNNQASLHLLAWSGPVSGVNYKIKVIKDNIVMDFQTEHTSIPVGLKDAGEYLWEVQGEAFSGVTSNKITGKIIIKAPLRLSQLPSEGAVIELEKPDQLVAFKWDDVDDSSLYQFELSDDPNFKKIIIARDVDSNNISTSLAETGRYFWRVKVKKGDNIEYSSPVSVEIRPSPPLARPEISPDIKIKLKFLDEKSSSFNIFNFFIAKAMASDPVAFAEWDLPKNSRAKSYVVEIYKDANLNELITKIETETPHVIWKNATPGTFYWRVAFMDFWGRQTEFSKVSTLSTELDPELIKDPIVEIELLTPKHRSEILKEEKDQGLLSWIEIPKANHYQVLIATDLEFDNIVLKKQVSQNQLTISCREFDNRAGDFYWKVIYKDNASKRRLFSIACAPPPLPDVPKKEEVIIPDPVEIKEIQSEPELSPHFLRLGSFPHQIAYQNKAGQYTAKVDGLALNSWFALYQTPLDMKYFQLLTPGLWVSRGKVFSNITFTDIEFNLKAHRRQSGFSWGPMVAFMKKTLYVESNLAISDESVSTPLAGIFIQKEIQRLTLNAELKVGTVLDYHADIHYRFQNNYSVGAFFDSSAITKDNNKHSATRYGLSLSYTFDFFDKRN